MLEFSFLNKLDFDLKIANLCLLLVFFFWSKFGLKKVRFWDFFVWFSAWQHWQHWQPPAGSPQTIVMTLPQCFLGGAVLFFRIPYGFSFYKTLLMGFLWPQASKAIMDRRDSTGVCIVPLLHCSCSIRVFISVLGMRWASGIVWLQLRKMSL